GVEEIFGIDEGVLRSATGDGDGLAELRRRLHIINAAADQAGFGHDRAILALVPAVAEADGAAVLELDRPADRSRQWIAHDAAPRGLKVKLVAEFRNSEFGIRSSEFGVRNSEFGIRSSELIRTRWRFLTPNSQLRTPNSEFSSFDLPRNVAPRKALFPQ